MKHLSYLNKYLLKYKYYLLLGIVFTILTILFQIVPAQIVRHAIDLVTDNIMLNRALEGLALQDEFYEVFAGSILIFAGIILLMALIRGFFLFLVRQESS